MNGINTFTKFWINPVMIMQKNSIYSSHFKRFCSNYVPSKLPVIPSHVGVFMLHIIYVLNVIMKLENMSFPCHLLFFVYIV